MAEPLRIFIGTEPKTRIMEQVLRYSIQRRTSQPVEFTSMDGPGWEIPKDLPRGTGFSLRRWVIPEKCNYTGRALYLDADIQCFADIAELGQVTLLNGASSAMTYQPDKFRSSPWPQSSVMLIDCAAAQRQWQPAVLWNKLRKGVIKYPEFMHASWMKPQPQKLPVEWNGLNKDYGGKVKLLHYTKEQLQPPYRPDQPLSRLWQEELERAIAAGAVSREDFEYGLSMWKVKEDWRNQNGLHPFYRKYLACFS